jgi:phosphomevalonate kinase
LSTSTSTETWAISACIDQNTNILSEYDHSYTLNNYNAYGVPNLVKIEGDYSAFCGGVPSQMYACAINFETSNGIEISGLNAEEQSDISFNVSWSANQAVGFSIEAFTFVDVMWVLRVSLFSNFSQTIIWILFNKMKFHVIKCDVNFKCLVVILD